MDHDSSPSGVAETQSAGVLPIDLAPGASILVASAGDPARHAVDLQTLAEYGRDEDTAFVVTTTLSVPSTREQYEQDGRDTGRPALRFVDTTARNPSVPTVYGESPTVSIPSSGDLERLVIALSDLAESTPVPDGDRHLVVRSLTPVLDAAPIDRVETVLERVTGLRTEAGLCLLGIDYTAHDGETITRLAEHVDGVLWVTESATNDIDVEYRPTQRSQPRQLFETPK